MSERNRSIWRSEDEFKDTEIGDGSALRISTRMVRINADHVSTRMTRRRRIFADFSSVEVRWTNGKKLEVARE